jgi:hypothetical protein
LAVPPIAEIHYKQQAQRRVFAMDIAAAVKTSPDFPVPETMKAWVLGGAGELGAPPNR